LRSAGNSEEKDWADSREGLIQKIYSEVATFALEAKLERW